MRINRKAILFAAAATTVSSSIALGVDRTWDGFSNNNFSLGSNWTASIAPVSTDNAFFRNQAGIVRSLVVMDANRTVAGFSIDGTPGVGAYEFQKTGTNLLTVTGNLGVGFAGLGATPVTFNGFRLSAANAFLGPSSTLNLTNSAQVTLTTDQFAVQNDAALNVTNSTISAPFLVTYNTSTTNVNSGGAITASLEMQSTSRVNVNSGGVLNIPGSNLIGGTLTLNSGGSINLTGGALDTNGAAFIQFNRDYALPADRSMFIDQGGKLSSTSYVDIGAAGNGTLLVSGATSSFTAGTALAANTYSDWGNNGFTGDVTISNSAQARYMAGLQIGAASAGATTGRLHLQTGGILTVDNFLRTGGLGTASLTIDGATLVSSGAATFDNHTTIALQNNGAMNFDGDGTFLSGSTLNWTGGNVNIAAGKSLNVSGGTINNTAGGQALGNGATIRVLNGGQFNNSSYFDVANGSSTGTLLVDGTNSKFIAPTSISDWGSSPGNNATVTFSNAGAGTYSIIRMSNVGGSSTLNLQANGTVNTAGFEAGFGTGSAPLARVNINGGTLTAASASTFLGGANVTLASGGLVLGGDATFSTGSRVNWSGGELVFTPGKTLNVNGGSIDITTTTASTTRLPDGATLNITDGGQFTSLDFYDLARDFNPATGTMLVDGAGSKFVTAGPFGSQWAAFPGNVATVTFSNSGAGTVTFLRLGGGTASVNLQSGGQLNFLTGLRSGGNPGSNVQINIAGGTFNSAGTANVDKGTVVNLSSGGLVLGGDATFSTGSTFNWSGGGAMIVASGKTLAFAGGVGSITSGGKELSSGATLAITNGGQFTGDGFYDIANAGASGTLLVDGTNSSIAVDSTFWGSNPGKTATGTFSNGGLGTFGELNLSAFGGTSTLTLQSGGRVTIGLLDAGATINNVRVNVDGGILDVTGDAFLNGATVVEYSAGSIGVAGNLNMFNTAKVLLTSGGNKVPHFGGLSMSDTSKIELADNDMIVSYTGPSPAATILGYLITGRNGGNWLGNGLTSSSAAANPSHTSLGYADNGSRILVKYTYLGDANLDGQVDISDLGALATAWQTSAVWSQGDFDYSGFVDISDLGSLATNWQAGVGSPLGPSFDEALASVGLAGVSVPEPTALALLAVGAVLIGRRRRVAS